jgi:hypothetical protein
MDTPNSSFPRGDLRVSDAERDRAVAELSEHFQTGRLTQEEFEDRSGRALRSRTGGELTELFTDLPPGLPPTAGQPPATASPGSVRRMGGVPPRVVIACVIAVIIVGNVLGHVLGHAHTRTISFGWLVPVLILGFLFRRTVGRR